MDRYSSLIGKRVEVEYRAGDLHLSAIGTLVAVKEKSIFLEDHMKQGDKNKTMRTEIPHVNVIRIVESPAPPAPTPSSSPASHTKRRR
jgi:hypothetical protein